MRQQDDVPDASSFLVYWHHAMHQAGSLLHQHHQQVQGPGGQADHGMAQVCGPPCGEEAPAASGPDSLR